MVCVGGLAAGAEEAAAPLCAWGVGACPAAGTADAGCAGLGGGGGGLEGIAALDEGCEEEACDDPTLGGGDGGTLRGSTDTVSPTLTCGAGAGAPLKPPLLLPFDDTPWAWVRLASRNSSLVTIPRG